MVASIGVVTIAAAVVVVVVVVVVVLVVVLVVPVVLVLELVLVDGTVQSQPEQSHEYWPSSVSQLISEPRASKTSSHVYVPKQNSVHLVSHWHPLHEQSNAYEMSEHVKS